MPNNIVMADVKGGGYTADDWFDMEKPIGEISFDGTVFPTGMTLKNRKGITKLNAPNVIVFPSGFCSGCANLAEINISHDVTKFETYAFSSAGILGTLFCPKATAVTESFKNTKLTYVILDYINGSQSEALANCPNLLGADFLLTSYAAIGAKTFRSSSKLNTLILRGTTRVGFNSAIVDGTSFSSGKSGGVIYVPQSLISEYESNSNIQSILAMNQNNQLLAIEGSYYETHYVDGTPIETGG